MCENLTQNDSSLRDIFENYSDCRDHEILMALIQYYLVSKIENSEESNENNKSSLSHALYNHIKLRLFCLDILKSLFNTVSIEYDCLKEILAVLDKLSFLGIAEVNSEIISVCKVVVNRINKSRSESSESLILSKESKEDDPIQQSSMINNELSVLNIVQCITTKIMSQMQDFVNNEPNYKDIKTKLEDSSFEGLEMSLVNTTQSLANEGASKLSTQLPAIIKDAFDLLSVTLQTLFVFKDK